MANVDIYAGASPRALPLYSVPDAARILRVRPATLRSWALGRRYPTRGGPRRWPALIRAADPKSNRLSFTNLVELHVLSVLRGRKIRVDRIRSATQFVRDEMGTDHPLANVDVHTDEVDLYVEFIGQLVNASRGGQAAMRPLIERYLTRIERDEKGLARRLFPATRPGDEELGPQTVVVDPARRFGRPLIEGTGIETSVVAERFRAGDSWSDISRDLALEPAAVEEAVRFEAMLRRAA